MRNSDEKFWIAEARITHAGAPLSSLCVARVPQRSSAKSALSHALRERGLNGEITLLGSSLEIRLDEAQRMAAALNDGEAAIRTFGWDDPRSLERHPALQRAPSIAAVTRSPAEIEHLLFAPPAKDTRPGGDHAYVVLDAARVFGLPERLENSGLEHACLFNGRSARDYAATAPWLVRLIPDHALTRSLTDANRISPLGWAAETGLLIRSPLSLQGMRRQLRKFTMIHDDTQQKRYYFRFYDPRVFRTLIASATPEVRAKFARGIRQIICPDMDGAALIFDRTTEGDHGQRA